LEIRDQHDITVEGYWDVTSGTTTKPGSGDDLKDWLKKSDEGMTTIALSVQPDP